MASVNMICTNHPSPSGQTVIMHADQSALSTELATCTATVATPVPGGIYNTVSGSFNDNATVNVSSTDFTSLTGMLATNSVLVTVTHSGSTITGFRFGIQQGLSGAVVDGQLDDASPHPLHREVGAMRAEVESIATQLADVRLAVDELLKRLRAA